MADSPFMRRLRQRARDLGSRAIDELLSSEDRADVVGAAVRGVQKGRQAIDESGGKVLGAIGLATQEDLERINKRLGKLRKRLRSILDDL